MSGYYIRTQYHKDISTRNLGNPKTRSGKLNGAWKGNMATNGAIHDWVSYHLKKPKECAYCGAEGRIEWASISHKAKRDLDDYIPLCVRCHRTYDGNMPKNTSYLEETKNKIRESVKKNWEVRRKKYGPSGNRKRIL